MPKLCDGTIENPTLKESRAFCEGMIYRTTGTENTAPSIDNPHPAGSADGAAWARGWDVANTLVSSVITDEAGGCCGTVGLGVPEFGDPTWIKLPPVRVPQGAPWTLQLTDYARGVDPLNFALDVGNLPTGITLNLDGSFSGTVTNAAGSGSAVFTVTDVNGSATSGTMAWTIGDS